MAKIILEVGRMPQLVLVDGLGRRRCTIDPFGIVRGDLRADLRRAVRAHPLHAVDVLVQAGFDGDRQLRHAWCHHVAETWRRWA